MPLADILYAMYENDAAYEAAPKAVAIDDQDAGAWGSLGAIEFGQEKIGRQRAKTMHGRLN